MSHQHQGRNERVRIISGKVNGISPETLGQFIRQCYEQWRDGCNNCVACTCIDSYEQGMSDANQFQWRMALLFDVLQDKVNHPLELPRPQLSMFANRGRA